LGQRYGVTGFPSKRLQLFTTTSVYISKIALKWFSADGTAEPYEGGRDLEALSALSVSFMVG